VRLRGSGPSPLTSTEFCVSHLERSRLWSRESLWSSRLVTDRPRDDARAVAISRHELSRRGERLRLSRLRGEYRRGKGSISISISIYRSIPISIYLYIYLFIYVYIHIIYIHIYIYHISYIYIYTYIYIYIYIYRLTRINARQNKRVEWQ